MGLFDILFGKRKTKQELIRELVKERFRSDPSLKMMGLTPEVVDRESDDALQGTAEATIVSIVENLKRHNVPENMIFELIEAQRSAFSGSGEVPSPINLNTYARYRIAHEYTTGAPVSDASVEYSVREAEKFFALR